MTRSGGRTTVRPVAALLVLSAALASSGCTIGERLAEVGRAPKLERPGDPTERPGWRPVRMPMPEPEPQIAAGPNSLWRSGARGFFRDQRARRVGDILTINVTINDKAELSNTSRRSRSNRDRFGLPNFFGLENKLPKVLPAPIDPASLVDADSSMLNRGLGETEREETIRLDVAAVVTQVLPNGNLVVEGRQEVRVNFEVREVVIAGVVRPEDITPKNTVSHDRIAELRVSYGGRGQLTDVQQPRYGAQVLDILLPY
ncbi:MAG: flagellar basal body L-ring protein FlgH [Geminicoccaceae bacterium]|nr:flagellar basal body L-ring protein FlgH [Geminicoccaceae bacterium]